MAGAWLGASRNSRTSQEERRLHDAVYRAIRGKCERIMVHLADGQLALLRDACHHRMKKVPVGAVNTLTPEYRGFIEALMEEGWGRIIINDIVRRAQEERQRQK